MTYNWLEHWEQGNIAFHQSTVNPLLEKYWSELDIKNTSCVLVPLCGKTLDLLWLANQGHHVIGVELSEIACEHFFIENSLSYDIQQCGELRRYYHLQDKKIELYCGDFFALSSAFLPAISAVYDRAALIALPDKLRKKYTQHLSQLITKNSQALLIVFDSSNIIQGPPYSVSVEEIKELFGSCFKIQELTREHKTDFPKHLYKKGYRDADEVVYHLIF